MPDFEDAWMSDIVVTLDVTPERSLDQMLVALRAAGLDVQDTDVDDATVQGIVETAKVYAIEHLPGVEYVRSNFMWIADYPPGDPRDRDGVARPS